jgi:predicted O-linked N-acetylglucosamine transferase (SPINDLY family)
MNISDIILDPYPFGGCNSSLEAFSLGKIVITCASNMINGRFTCGFYKKMDLEYLITYNKDDYVNLALKIANDKAFKLDAETKIKEKSKILFNDEESINEWKNDIKNIYSNL